MVEAKSLIFVDGMNLDKLIIFSIALHKDKKLRYLKMQTYGGSTEIKISAKRKAYKKAKFKKMFNRVIARYNLLEA